MGALQTEAVEEEMEVVEEEEEDGGTPKGLGVLDAP